MDPANRDPSLPTGHPFTNVVPRFPYWSMTTSAEFFSGAWVEDFRNEGSACTRISPASRQSSWEDSLPQARVPSVLRVGPLYFFFLQ